MTTVLFNYLATEILNKNIPFFMLDLLFTVLVALSPLLVFRVFRRFGQEFDPQFQLTVVIIILVSSAVTEAVQESIARAIALFGVAAIVRFRTPVKSFVESALLLAALGIGIINGASNFLAAELFLFFLALTVGLFFLLGGGGFRRSARTLLLRFTVFRDAPSADLSETTLAKLEKAHPEVRALRLSHRYFSSELKVEKLSVNVTLAAGALLPEAFLSNILREISGEKKTYEIVGGAAGL